tara:strand:+ start:1116 stop:1751 length:636 start_codon:yes stop_codon:yes gene_type:complete
LLSKQLKKAIIALHGWTGNASSMKPISKNFNYPDTKWVFPQAPYHLNKANQSLKKDDEITGYSWSKKSMRNDCSPKKKHVEKSMNIISNCIADLENEGFNKKNIFILGFSQGAIFSLWFIIKQKYSLGGCISIAGGFDKQKNFISENLSSESKLTPILLLHGLKDKIILPEESKKTKKMFRFFGYNVKIHLYPSGHKIPIKVKDIIWLFLT